MWPTSKTEEVSQNSSVIKLADNRVEKLEPPRNYITTRKQENTLQYTKH